MKKIALASLAAAAAFAVPTAGYAQDAKSEVTIGATVGVHDLGVDDDIATIGGFPIEDSGAIFGGFVAVDFPLSSNIFAGIEGNANFGTQAIDADYGASVRLGYRTNSGTKLYLRGGYQEVDIDVNGLLGLDDGTITDDELGISTTVGDYLVGAGVEVPLGKAVLRGNVDTIAFDSLRATAGVGFRF